ncbi:MAG TPA: hypothetical protein VFJ64_00400 [Solirubrobacterales bacterium]|nr:hypothetical protein [Solirubrobacterales bacterium]
MTNYYLDTTALIERWAGEARVREEILALLDGGDHATSSHVRREWKRIIDGTAADVLNAIRDGQDDFGSIFARLAQGWGRQPGQRLRVLAMLANQLRNSSPVELQLRAQQILRCGSKQMFMHHIQEVRDGSECGLAKNEVRRGRDGRYALIDRCKRTDEICRQDQYVQDELPRWEGASQGLVDHSNRPSDQNMGKLGLELAASSAKRKGRNCYDKTGDISISLECDPDEVLLTTDQSFESMATKTGMSVKRIKATSPP